LRKIPQRSSAALLRSSSVLEVRVAVEIVQAVDPLLDELR